MADAVKANNMRKTIRFPIFNHKTIERDLSQLFFAFSDVLLCFASATFVSWHGVKIDAKHWVSNQLNLSAAAGLCDSCQNEA